MRWFARGTNLLGVAAIIVSCLLAVLVVDTVQSRDSEARTASQATKTANEAVAELRALDAADGAKIDALRSQIAALGAIPVSQPAALPSPVASGAAPHATTPTTRPAQPVSRTPVTTASPKPPATPTPTTQPSHPQPPPHPSPPPCTTLPLIGCIP